MAKTRSHVPEIRNLEGKVLLGSSKRQQISIYKAIYLFSATLLHLHSATGTLIVVVVVVVFLAFSGEHFLHHLPILQVPVGLC